MILIGLASLLTLFYVLLIAVYVYGWIQLPNQQEAGFESITPTNNSVIDGQGLFGGDSRPQPSTTVCVIVPARNEADRIGACLEALIAQEYPAHLLEIIAVDDHSTDQTPAIIASFDRVRLLRLADLLPPNLLTTAYKKKAIEIAIAHTQQTLIVTTDADCIMSPQWLASLVYGYERKQAHIIAAPVQYIGEKKFVERFQSLDIVGMMVATGASLHLRLSAMCNGANLAYRRETFYAVGGFEGIDHLASGDDMLLMAKIVQQYPDGVVYLKQLSATVYTYAQPTWYDFAQQRLRWASKSTSYQDRRITWLLAGVYLFNVSIVVCFLAASIGVSSLYWWVGLGQLLAKNIADAVFLTIGCRFFRRTDLLKWFIPAQLVHIFYIIIIGAFGNLGVYTWKNRRVQ